MAKKELAGLPFPPLQRVETDAPLTEQHLGDVLRGRPEGISLCVRGASGHPDRGGYFFHVCPRDADLRECEVFDFEKTPVAVLPLAKLTEFVNHCAGLAFSEEMFRFCQNEVNFRLDPADPTDPLDPAAE